MESKGKDKDIRRIASAARPACPINCDEIEDTDAVLEIFQYWQEVMNHPKAKLDNKRRQKIKIALKQYSAADLKLTIRGCSCNPYHMGNNDSKTVYDSLDLIFRDAEHIEKFIALAQQPFNHTISMISSINNGKSLVADNIFVGAV